MPSAIFLLGLFSLQNSAVTPDPYLKSIEGPTYYCGNAFALNVGKDERVVWRFPVHDFVLHDLSGPSGSFTIYEGNFPSTFNRVRTTIKVPGLNRVERLRDSTGGVSYLIATKEKWPAYLHVIGDLWKGNASDVSLLSRVLIGRTNRCKSATFKMDS